MLLLTREDEKYHEGISEMFNAAVDFMKSRGMTNEQINDFRASVVKTSDVID